MKQTPRFDLGNLKGVAGWLLRRVGPRSRSQPRLAVLERVSLAPRQSLALVEAEGRKVLVAASSEGSVAFFALDGPDSRTVEECSCSCAIAVRGCVW